MNGGTCFSVDCDSKILKSLPIGFFCIGLGFGALLLRFRGIGLHLGIGQSLRVHPQFGLDSIQLVIARSLRWPIMGRNVVLLGIEHGSFIVGLPFAGIFQSPQPLHSLIKVLIQHVLVGQFVFAGRCSRLPHVGLLLLQREKGLRHDFALCRLNQPIKVVAARFAIIFLHELRHQVAQGILILQLQLLLLQGDLLLALLNLAQALLLKGFRALNGIYWPCLGRLNIECS